MPGIIRPKFTNKSLWLTLSLCNRSRTGRNSHLLATPTQCRHMPTLSTRSLASRAIPKT
jgi:hypothetical protein